MTDTKADPARKRESWPRPTHDKADPEQSRRFIEKARELGCEENLDRFDEAVKRVGKARRPPQLTKKAE